LRGLHIQKSAIFEMKFSIVQSFAAIASLTSATILQNGQVRITDYPNTVIDASKYSFNTYPPNAKELSYKGRWDSEHISWWSYVLCYPIHALAEE
jgi:hypothetical protein